MTDDKIVRHIPKSMVPFAREMGWIEGKDYIIVKPLPYDKARSSRVRIDNVSIKGHEAFTVLDADGRIVAHTARKGKE